MKAIYSFVLLLGISLLQITYGDEPYIIGGRDALEKEIPFIVSLRGFFKKHVCGGAILTKRWVITAAHCVSPIAPKSLIAGSTTLNGGTKYKIALSVAHPYFCSNSLTNDIALLQTRDDIIFNDYVQPIPLATMEFSDDTPMITAGWGYTTLSSRSANNNLQYYDTKSVNFALCNKTVSDMYPGRELSSKQMCSATQPNHGLCIGDYGGPVVDSAKSLLFGVSSFSLEYCAKGYPDVLTKVKEYTAFINTYTKGT